MSEYAVTNPATGERVEEYPTISDAALADAVAAADRAHREWSRTTTTEERAALVRRVGELHVERREELAEIIVREMGKPVEQALGEVDFCASIYEYYATEATSLLADEPIALSDGEGSAFVRRSSVGVLLGIMPWNYPYYQVARFAGPNLVVGNTILLKHAPQCPESAAAIQRIYDEAGFPAGAYTNIYATNDQVADVIADPRVQGVSVTGSERAGAAVAEVAGRNLKKVVLELGGSDPFILLSTDDLDGVVESAVAARLENAGQACNAAKRFVVAADLYEPFVDKLTAALTAVEPTDPSSPDAAMGPLSSETAADRLDDQLRRAVAGGATLVGGTRERELRLARRADGRDAGQRRVPRRAVRPGRDRLPRRVRGRGRRGRERHAVRPRLLRVHDRSRPGAARCRPDRGRDGLRQHRRCGRRRAAVRRRQALGLRAGARPLRDGGVREPEDDPAYGEPEIKSLPRRSDPEGLRVGRVFERRRSLRVAFVDRNASRGDKNNHAMRNDSASEDARPDRTPRGPVRRARRLDAVDRGIIEALQRNGREAFRRIAVTLGVSEATIRARYARLCADNILQVTGVTNPLGLGFEAQAMVGIRTAGPPEGRGRGLALGGGRLRRRHRRSVRRARRARLRRPASAARRDEQDPRSPRRDHDRDVPVPRAVEAALRLGSSRARADRRGRTNDCFVEGSCPIAVFESSTACPGVRQSRTSTVTPTASAS